VNRLSIRMPGDPGAHVAPRAKSPRPPIELSEPSYDQVSAWLAGARYDIEAEDAMPYVSAPWPPPPMHTPDAKVSQPYGWVSEWLVEEGRRVRAGQPVAEVTDFHGVSTVIRSAYDGHIMWILTPKDSLCYVGQQLYIMIVDGDVFSNRGGPRLKFLTPAFRHEAMSWWARTYNLRL
jgi:biotin carboxyl carrier protein